MFQKGPDNHKNQQSMLPKGPDNHNPTKTAEITGYTYLRASIHIQYITIVIEVV
jgi:hypothetical protein